MKTKTLGILIACALTACNSTTTTTYTTKDGKTVTTVVKKEASDGIVTTVTNALLGGFLSAFQTK